MENYYYGLSLSIFIVIAIAISDQNVADYINLTFKLVKVNIERMLWMIRFHPQNPITNLMMKWKYDRIAKQLQKEYKE
jgi:hypothetical protein